MGGKNVADCRQAEADTHQSRPGHQDVSRDVGLLAAQGATGGLTVVVAALLAAGRRVAADLMQELD